MTYGFSKAPDIAEHYLCGCPGGRRCTSSWWVALLVATGLGPGLVLSFNPILLVLASVVSGFRDSELSKVIPASLSGA